MIDYDKYYLEKKENRKYYILAAAILFIIGYLFYCSLPISLICAWLAIPLKKIYVAFKIKQRKENLKQAFRDLLYSLSSSISSGRQMGEALIEAHDDLSLMYDEKEPIIRELLYIKNAIETSRASEEILLRDFAYRSGIEEIISFADVYSTCRTTGANSEAMITKASQVLMDKLAIIKEIKTITSQKMAEAKMISSMPIIIIIFLNLVSPGYLDLMYHTVVGRLVMTAALAAMFFSYYVMNKIVEVRI